jgi:hypothetical protein
LNDIDLELVERHKNEVWKLELNKQELLQKIYGLSQSLYTSSSEQKRLTREQLKLTQELDQLKTVQHIWETDLKDAQEQHKQEVIELRKLLHSCRIEKDQLLKQLQEAKTHHMLITKQQQRVDMPAGVNSLDGNIVPSPTPPSVITQNSCHQKSGTIVRHMEETKALKVSLKHAQDVIQTIQVDALLGETQETMGRSRYSSDTSSSEAVMGERSEEVLDLKLPQSPIIDISAEGDLVDNMDNESSNSSQAIALQANQYRNSVASRRNSTPTCTCLIKNHMPTSTNDVLIKEKEIYLTCVDLPAISNHEMYNSFSSSSISNSSSGNTSKAKIQIMKHNQEYYGSLIKEPESYIYRSQIKDRVEEKENLSQSSLPTLPSITANLDSMVNMNHSETKQEIKKTETGSSSSFATAMAHTMIGEWIWKYTRKVVGSGISEHRHRRFFWINPYTRTLYWSIHVPGANGNQLSTKSGMRTIKW